MDFSSKIVCILSFIFYASWAYGQQVHSLYDGQLAQQIALQDVLKTVQAGDIVIIGEIHDRVMDHQHQVEFIQGLIQQGFVVNVGMEFLSYTDQSVVDGYMDGQFSEDEFLAKVEWGGTPFALYRQQMQLAKLSGGQVIALNMPRKVTKDISKNGLDNISAEHQLLMPPNFELGNELYFERFMAAVGAHEHNQMIVNMFSAQCTWDETMAWKAIEFLKDKPNEVMVIIVGNFHVLYGGGLPDRIKARGYSQLKTVVHLGIDDIDSLDGLRPHPKYGQLGDWIWLSEYEK